MNPLSLLFRALDSALRTFLSLRLKLRATPWRRRTRTALRSFWTTLRTTPWRRHARAVARSFWTTLRTTPWRRHARTALRSFWTTLRTTPWRRHAHTALARLSDRQWWRSVASRGAARARRPRTLRLGLAAVLGGVVLAASATTAVAVHDGGGAPATQAADTAAQQPATRQHTAASRGNDRPAPSPSSTPSHEPAKPAQKQKSAHKPAKKHAPHKHPKHAKHTKRPQYVERGSSWRLPVHAKRFWVSSRFGTRWGVLHAGVDLAVPMRTPIHAAHSGRVSIAGHYGGYGRAVGIENGHGIATVYGHTSKVLVHDGQWVRANQVIALSGNTGDSRGPHLHFEMRRHGVPFNPLPYLKAHGVHVLRAAGHG